MTEAPDTPTLTYPITRTCPFASAAQYARIRSEQPITRVTMEHGGVAWLITSHKHARQILSNPAASKNGLRPGYPALAPNQAAAMAANRGFLVMMDPPEHTLFRRMLAGEFSVRGVARFRPYIEKTVDEHIDRMLAGERPVDLVQALALPVPAMALCEMLGIPYTSQRFFQLSTSDIPYEERREIQRELRAYLAEHIAERQRSPHGNDLLGRLVIRFQKSGQQDPKILHGLAMNVMLGGGRVAITAMISLGMLVLMRDPVQRGEMLSDPVLLTQAVEELLRYFSVGDLSTHRIATEDIEVGGVLIRAGEGIVLPNDAANHDPEVFENPDEFDLHRDAKPQLAFGAGVHQCVGQHLTRLVLEVVYPAIFRRIPEIRLAVPLDEVPFVYASAPINAEKLMVTW
jgi:cytochrome P450